MSTEACVATGQGGWIDVTCDNSRSGVLIVQENNWRGWFAWRDGQRINALDWRWLTVSAPAGTHAYRFRYIPLDVFLGILLNLLGVALSIHFWRQQEAG